ncbi:GNAT family N-acetyltransferase [Thioclava marina]|uniref:GNAT family N-acetyltransferase n=1 Tax=Thioclava marina TaxID=1915077 RepID=A0ABX3MI56_9RHOB|nr:GNAT family N-acetyltransferase [Thioclava marina]OOY10898.1 GNAT family N-acetyltransferase [Thioclava marina]
MPTDPSAGARFTIEPFDPKTQDRAAFGCGVGQIDNYLKLTAKKGAKADMVRIWVVLDDARRILGFYAINMHSVMAAEMPASLARKALGHGVLPAAFISMIGVDLSMQGQGLGSALLADALSRIGRVSEEIGTCAVLLDVFDCGDAGQVARRKRYYESFGFIALPDQPLRLFMPIQTVRALSG